MFNNGQEMFVRQYFGPRKGVGTQILRKLEPLFYKVKVGNQIYSRHASQMLQNCAKHQDLSDRHQAYLLDITFTSKSLKEPKSTPT